jgi:UDP-GlcNAc:undecaprenyl-phosphate/decaprenyl-phosphate GlcNAc-1-phosphate transferase
VVLLSLVAAFALSLGWCALSLNVGPRVGFVDTPDETHLKVHRRPAVPLGGVGIFLGVHAALIVGDALDIGLLIATGVLLLLGLADDRLGLSPVVRLSGEVVAGVALVTWGELDLDGPLVGALAIALVVVTVNAVNLFDGLDGLAGSAALISALGLAWLAMVRDADPLIGLATAAALAGFLILNRHPARVFLGDNGAYVTGGFLAFAVLTSSEKAGLESIVVASLFLGVFLVDLIITVIRRARSGVALFAGDRSHVYDQLHDRGWSIGKVAGAAALAQAVFVIVGMGVDRLGATVAPWAAVAVGVAAVVGLMATGFVSRRVTN